ncbi:hypothetical protein EIP86_009016 [Pleurotus ostreatoroseus]|nr:hypothetical protein EIP86_009016 [Pleurotus ostreatoroseus]
MHVIPEANLGINVLGFGGAAYVSADAALTLTFSVDTSAATVSVDTSLDFAGGVQQTSKSGNTALIGPYHFYRNSWNLYNYSLPFGSTSEDDLALPPNTTAFRPPTFLESFPVHDYSLQKRAGGLSGILGSLKCPSKTSQNTDFSQELEDDDTNLDPDDVSNEMLRRSLGTEVHPVDSLIPGA